jgi:hypothetical protein
MTNESFRPVLINYFRHGQLHRADKLLAAWSPEYVFKKNASIVSEEFKKLRPAETGFAEHEQECERYAGKNIIAKKISEYLNQNAKHYLVGAYAHGSVGTSEEVAYSDFDGLAIVKNSCLADSEKLFDLVLSLKATETMMLEMDPLQHHGWFIIAESELDDFPEFYFPRILFNHAKCLVGQTAFKVRLRKSGYHREFKEAFHNLSESILQKITDKSFQTNYYQLKNWLSQILLLPAVFLQAETGEGIFKKESFESIKKESDLNCDVLSAISEIRKQWHYEAPPSFLARQQKASPLRSRNRSGMMSGEIPVDLIKRLNESVTDELIAMINQMKSKIDSLKF